MKDQQGQKITVLQPCNDNAGQDLAILVIDVQQEYCDPANNARRGTPQTDEIAGHIAEIVPKFRAAGVRVYAVYFKSWGISSGKVDWHKFKPAANDILVPKNEDSAFQGSGIKKILQKHGHKNLFACGFNRSYCVRQTIMDARREGFNVTLLSDLTGNDNCACYPEEEDFADFTEKGIKVVSSSEALAELGKQELLSNVFNPAVQSKRLGFRARVKKALGFSLGPV